ncbi:unnamed protein product [Darwinula stevensoni]|uniref:Cullin family profile domain-containing protein n=1 Tax=Darwinula stevensoni TaxID=69355 RepID=A0A7R8XAL6_9CRUS|nr:unnamed protein product [Darwinula stevensoni]CAG0890404.1 unnamed protein product [Darwinula stevensoni]
MRCEKKNIGKLSDRFGLSQTTADDRHTDALWQSLKSALEKILRKDCYGLSSEDLQRAVRAMVLDKQGRRLYAGLRRVVARHLEEEQSTHWPVLTQSDISKASDPTFGRLRPTTADFGCLRNDFQRNEPTRLNPAIRRTGSSLDQIYRLKVAYENLSNDNQVREDLLESPPSDLLQTLVLAWTDHKISLTIISDILGYLDRVYVPQNGVEDVYGLGLALFRDHVIKYGEIKEQLKEALSDMVTRERKGETVDRSMIRDITTMLAMLGGDIYKKVFEEPFLQQAVEFYRVKSRNFLEGGSSVREEGSRTNGEKEGASHYAKDAVIQEVQDESICDHMETIVERESPEIARMLRDGSAEELRSRYDLHSSVPEGSNITAKCVSAYLRERGRALAAEAEGPVSHVQSLLDLKKQLDDLLCSSFRYDRFVEEAIAREFQRLLALDPRSAERLSLFIDHAMKRGEEGMTEPEIEAALDEATALFRLLPEKEAFQRCYERHLAKRLLLESVSEEIEGSMISRLKAECGSQYTAKLEGMLKDIAVSNAIATELKHRIASTGENQPGLDLTVRVLTAGIWPARPVAPECAVPVEALAAFEAFRRFYLSLHSGRKLTLQPQLGSANLKATFYEPRREDGEAGDGGSSFARLDSRRPSPGSAFSSARPDGGSVGAWGGEAGGARHHVIHVSTFQMCILMLFNDRSRISYSEIATETHIPERDLIRALQSLALGKAAQRILIKNPETGDIEPNDVFAINESFTSKLYRVKIHTTKGRSERKIETHSQADEDEKQEIEDANICITKSCKRPPHNPLTTEVPERLKGRLLPSPVVLEKRIKGLIEREYLDRRNDDRELYTYVA